jgi:enoyl-CoA hydratase/carnithine racemase
MAEIELRIDGRRADLILNRPDRRNALSLSMWTAIAGLAAEAAAVPGLRVLVVRGAGGAFSAGADISEFAEAYRTPEAALANQAVMAKAMSAIEDFPLPTVAEISGPCVGGACGLALCCDLRIAGADARFGITPAKLGLSYGIADTRRLAQAVGVSRAKDILFTGRLIGAEEALGIGLIDRVATPVEAETAALAADLCAASGHTARVVKETFAALRAGAVDDDNGSRARFAAAFSGPDFREGVAAFMQKRPPQFP